MKILGESLRFAIFCAIFSCLFSFLNGAESSNFKKGLIKVKEVEIIRARFGAGPDEIGVTTPSEANPEGPMSFALGKDEEIYILDQINSRIQVFKDRKRIKTTYISVKESIGFKDIVLIPEDKFVLLGICYEGGHEKTALYVIDSTGKILNIIPLEDKRLIPNSGEVTEIRIVKEGKFTGIWVDLGERSVKVASLDGKSIERISVPGKLSLNGKGLLRAEKIGDITAVIYRSEEDSFSKWEPERTVNFEMTIVQLFGIWDDQKGRIYLGAFLEDQSKSSNTIVVFSPEGKELGYLNLFVQSMPHEIWQSIRVSSEGNIFQMALDEKGVFVRKYTLMK